MSFDLKVVNGNLAFKNGDLDIVKGTDKLIQDILKIAFTTAGSNSLHPYYGCLISKSVVGSNLDSEILFTVAQSQLQTAIETLKNLQKDQADKLQRISPDEQIASIMDISINRNNVDPRLIDVIIKVLTRSLSKTSATFSIKNF